MSRLDEDLRNAMRVIAIAAEEKPKPWSRIFQSRGLRWALAGAVCLMLAIAGIEYRQAREERARGEAAKDQLMLALRLAGGKLQYAQSKIQQQATPPKY